MSGIRTQLKAQFESLDHFLDVWKDGMLLEELGPKLTCAEADALANLLIEHGEGASAGVLLDSHCLEDDCGDDAEHLERKKEVEARLERERALSKQVFKADISKGWGS